MRRDDRRRPSFIEVGGGSAFHRQARDHDRPPDALFLGGGRERVTKKPGLSRRPLPRLSSAGVDLCIR